MVGYPRQKRKRERERGTRNPSCTMQRDILCQWISREQTRAYDEVLDGRPRRGRLKPRHSIYSHDEWQSLIYIGLRGTLQNRNVSQPYNNIRAETRLTSARIRLMVLIDRRKSHTLLHTRNSEHKGAVGGGGGGTMRFCENALSRTCKRAKTPRARSRVLERLEIISPCARRLFNPRRVTSGLLDISRL